MLVPDSLENPMGGMGEQAKQLLKNFKHQCTVIGSSKQLATDYGNGKRFFPITEAPIPLGNTDPHLNNIFQQSAFVAATLNLEKHDVVHAFDWNAFYPGFLIAKKWNVPLVITIQLSINELTKNLQPSDSHSDISLFLKGIEYFGLINANAIIQVSQSYAKNFPRYFYPKTRVIYNGIDNKEWRKTEIFKLPGDNKTKVIFLGRLAYQKGVHLLLKSTIPKDIDLIYIGGDRGSNTELQDEIIKQSQKQKNIHYLGALYGKEKIGALQAADAVIMPSIHEPFGIVALEALASKSILISSFVNGMGDFLSEDVAIKCELSPKGINKALKTFLHTSKEERKKRIEKGVKLCSKFDWSQITKEVEEVYEDVYEDVLQICQD